MNVGMNERDLVVTRLSQASLDTLLSRERERGLK